MENITASESDVFNQTYLAAHVQLSTMAPDPSLELIHAGPPSWVYRHDDVVAHVTPAQNPEDFLDRTARTVLALEKLRARGAQVPQHLAQPMLHKNYITTLMEYLPEEEVAPYDFGAAIASLHNASSHIDISEHLPVADLLARPRMAHEFMRENMRGTALYIGNVALSRGFMHFYGDKLQQAEEELHIFNNLGEEAGYPKVALHIDVHKGNVRKNQEGVATLIDIEDMGVGYAEYDLTRPLTQWHHRFGGPIETTDMFMAGYSDNALRQPNPKMQQLANSIANMRFATALISKEVNTMLSGHTPSEGALQEGINRTLNMDDPTFAWTPLSQIKAA